MSRTFPINVNNMVRVCMCARVCMCVFDQQFSYCWFGRVRHRGHFAGFAVGKLSSLFGLGPLAVVGNDSGDILEVASETLHAHQGCLGARRLQAMQDDGHSVGVGFGWNSASEQTW